jgi:hypothetical protein
MKSVLFAIFFVAILPNQTAWARRGGSDSGGTQDTYFNQDAKEVEFSEELKNEGLRDLDLKKALEQALEACQQGHNGITLYDGRWIGCEDLD